MPEITSIHNPKIQLLRELMDKRSAREAQGEFVVEGVRLSEEALEHGPSPTAVYYSESLSERGLKIVSDCESRNIRTISVADHILQRVSEAETSQGILMTLPFPSAPLPAVLDFVLVLDQIRDPGNAGTMLRSAAAAGVQAVLLTPGTTDIFAPKVVRAGMGAHFRLSFQAAPWPEILGICKSREHPLALMLAESGEGTPVWQQDLRQPSAIVIGGEAEGAGADARQHCDSLICVPMPGQFESLNAAVAAGIILFEVVRQRQV